jgi:hypothetical protein
MERYNSNKVCRDKRQAAVTKYIVLDNIQDFLCNLGMKPHVHLVEISIFSLNHVIVIIDNFGRSDDEMI